MFLPTSSVTSFWRAQVSIEIPSIKATLSDREYDLITSIAGDNFKEEQQVPKAALWLENHLLKGDDSEDEGDSAATGDRAIRCFYSLSHNGNLAQNFDSVLEEDSQRTRLCLSEHPCTCIPTSQFPSLGGKVDWL